MLTLNFNLEAFKADLQVVLLNSANECMERFYNTAKRELKANDIVLEKAIYDDVSEHIIDKCIFYADAILESYGKGEQMDVNNPYLKEYIRSELWNPSRKQSVGASIVGRPAGDYTNIFGEKSTSSGLKEGVPLGKVTKKPTYAIQNAERELKQENGYVDRILSRHISNFLKTTGKYFYNTKV